MKRIHLTCTMCAWLGCAVAVGCADNDQVTSTPDGGAAAASGSQATSRVGGASGEPTEAAGTSNAHGGTPALDSDAGTAGQAGGAGAAGSAGADDGISGGGSSSGGSSRNGGTAGSGTATASSKPLEGYTLFAIMDANSDYTQTQLVNMSGDLVHTWNLGGVGQKMLPGGDLIGSQGVFPGDYDSVSFEQVSWAGDVRWAFSNSHELRTARGAPAHTTISSAKVTPWVTTRPVKTSSRAAARSCSATSRARCPRSATIN